MNLNAGNMAALTSVSCGAPGDCTAGGYYTDSNGHPQPFLVSQRKGHWGQALKVRGAVSSGPFADVASLSCAGPGECTAGGYYSVNAHRTQAFVLSERTGRWGAATKVPGLAALSKGSAAAGLVSCSSPGNCGVIGGYLNAAHNEAAFAVTERSGRWGMATPLRGFGSTNFTLYSMSCGGAGDCAAAGFGHDDEAILISEHNGHWTSAITVPGVAALATGGLADANSVSCPAVGACTAVGGYATKSGHDESFVVNEKQGRWRRAFELPHIAALPGGQHATMYNVSCAAAGDCSAGGMNLSKSGQEVFVAGERNGRWGTPTELPGLVALNVGHIAIAGSMSCAASGDCAIGGSYTDGSKETVAFVASELGGRWSKAIKVPNSSLINSGGYSYVTSLSCRAPGQCSAGGTYRDVAAFSQVFVVSQS